ncbi:MAG: T9SS type A sorting domain-containing protein [Bacteroidetes bacterium]|nr:T9SS type A sorting domain-containing protein [Bacteroidota bacterium]
MKIIFNGLLILLCSSSLFAQGPGLSFSQSSGTYTPITGGTVLISGVFDDNNFTVNLPVPFTFRATAYTRVTVNSNGWIALGNVAPSTSLYTPVSSSTAVPGLIAPFGMDLENADSGSPEMRWEYAGNEIIFQWKDVKRYTTALNTEIFSFQARLHTVTGSIQFVYDNFQNTTTSTSSPQVGIRLSTNSFPSDIYNRLVNTTAPSNNWATSIEGTGNTSTCRLSATAPATVPASGQTFTWTPADCSTLSCSNLLSPAAGSTINNTSVNFSWTAVPGAIAYKLYSGTSFPLTLQGSYAGTTATVSGLLPNTNYSWYVVPVGFNCEVTGCESSAITFNSGCLALNCVTNLSPANGSTTSNGNVTLSWNATTATAYDLYLGTSNPPSFYGTYTTTSATVLVLPGTYNWYIVPRTSCSTPTGCEANTTSFTYASPVPNDICFTAIDLASVAGTTVSTAGGTTEGIVYPGACASGSRDIWYKFRAITSTASVSVSGSGTPCYDPGIQVLSGNCSNLQCFGSNDAGSCTTLNTVDLTGLTVGNIYYVRIFSSSTGGGQFLITGTNIGTTVLPLKLLSFTATRQNKDALLQWKTTGEINLHHFEMERSEDGIHYRTIQNIAAGNTQYSFRDAGIFNNTTVVYYRLKCTDVDGRFTNSNTLRLKATLNETLQIYPNPVTDVFTISGLKPGGVVKVWTAAGQLLQQQKVVAQTMRMDGSTWAKGIYLLQYESEKGIEFQKISKQ